MLNKVKLSTMVLLVLLMQATQADQRCQTGHIVATAPSSRYQQNDNGTVVDKETGLMWRSCVEGVAGKTCNQKEPLELNWAEALLYVSTFNSQGGFAGYKDWRLPNIRELSTLIELQCADPAINRYAFPNAGSLHVWTSSPSHFVNHYSWYVDFRTGAFTYGERIKAKAVRLVRDNLNR